MVEWPASATSDRTVLSFLSSWSRVRSQPTACRHFPPSCPTAGKERPKPSVLCRRRKICRLLRRDPPCHANWLFCCVPPLEFRSAPMDDDPPPQGPARWGFQFLFLGGVHYRPRLTNTRPPLWLNLQVAYVFSYVSAPEIRSFFAYHQVTNTVEQALEGLAGRSTDGHKSGGWVTQNCWPNPNRPPPRFPRFQRGVGVQREAATMLSLP